MQEEKNKQLSCYTIGHSNQTIEDFVEKLKQHKINCVVDIRSSPQSKHNPQFNKISLQEEMKKHSIVYIYIGDLLGGRYDNPQLLYPDGKVNYKKVRELDSFKKGINRIINGIEKGYILTLMCSEKDPYNCHRFVLISYQFSKMSVTVKHILEDGEIIFNADLEKQLMLEYKTKYQQEHLFNKSSIISDNIEDAYEERNREIAYTYEKKEIIN